ncbi:hypothetical protein MKEN_00586500 [Mycena kentingensis (nom. inval.)]|nr:hypothetical protein MKEN_00586500 [Mycena kentingensis (nom. inval.)]
MPLKRSVRTLSASIKSATRPAFAGKTPASVIVPSSTRDSQAPRMLVDAPLPTPAICAFAEFAIPFDDPHFKRGAEGKPIPDIYPYDAPPPYRPSYFRNVPKRVSFSNVEELERLVMGRLWYHEKENDRDRCILYNLLERRTLLAKWSEEATRMFELFETLTNTAPQGDVYIDAMVVLHARWTARSFMRLRNLKPLQVRARGSVGSSQELNSNITYLPTQKQGVQSTHF